MDSIRRGFGFFKQAWQMAFKDRDLIKPTFYAMVLGFIVSIVGLVPIVLSAIVFGDTRFGNLVAGGLGLLLIFIQYTITYIFSAMTIHLIYGYLSEGDGRMDRAWGIVRRDLLDIVSLAAASTVVKFVEGLLRGRNRRGGSNLAASLLNTVWTEATYLVLPAMVIEDIGLGAGLKRATEIVRNNLLLIGVSTVGVGFVTGLLGFLLGAAGVVLGFAVGYGLYSLVGSVVGVVAGIVIGGAIALTLILVAVLVGSYTATAYHTCLYIWARDVEKAKEGPGWAAQVAAPAPLASVL